MVRIKGTVVWFSMHSVAARPEVFRVVSRCNYREQFGECPGKLLSEPESMLLEGNYVLGEGGQRFRIGFYLLL